MLSMTSLIAIAVSEALKAEAPKGWHGGLESSLTFFSGNRKTDNILVVGVAKNDMGGSRMYADAYYSWARQTPAGGGPFSVTTDMWSLGGKYEKDFGKKSFWYLSARFDRDSVNFLNLRQVYGAGVGFTVFDDEVSTWRLSVGASQVMEDYTSGNNSFTGAQAESNYSRKLSNKLSVDHTFLYVPNVSDFGDYFYVSNLGFTYAMNGSMTAGLRYIVVFDSSPALGAVRQNTTYAFTLGYKF